MSFKKFYRTPIILEKEQYQLSGYTEKLLLDTANVHIDHFRKQSLFNNMIFDWYNLIVDEINNNYGACHKDNDSENGIKKKDEYTLIINPVTEDPHDYFEYFVDGRIVAKPSKLKESIQKAEHTIRVFNLNHPILKDKRCSIIRSICQLKQGGCSSQEIKQILSNRGFISVVDYFCSQKIFDNLS